MNSLNIELERLSGVRQRLSDDQESLRTQLPASKEALSAAEKAKAEAVEAGEDLIAIALSEVSLGYPFVCSDQSVGRLTPYCADRDYRISIFLVSRVARPQPKGIRSLSSYIPWKGRRFPARAV